MICEKCGKDIEPGVLNWATHSCVTLEYRCATDNEMRIKLMELDAPAIIFEKMGLATPTKTERKIYQQNPEK